jgi:hypothetical protein
MKLWFEGSIVNPHAKYRLPAKLLSRERTMSSLDEK